MTATSQLERKSLSSVDNVLQVYARAAVNVYFPAVDDHGSPSIGRFLIDNGRLPYASDEIKPWAYRGWLIPYIQMCEVHPGIAARYDYVMRTVDAGELLDERIPQVKFISEHAREAADGMKMLRDMVNLVDARTGYSRSFEKIVRWLSFGLGTTHEAVDLSDEIQEQLYRRFDVSRWLLAPTDYLGEYMAENNIGKGAAFFPTPMSICTMMAELTHGHGDNRTKRAMDCCVGTGRLLLTASNYCLRLFGQDINWMCVEVTKINLALYAPWFLIPESLFPEDPVPDPIETPAMAEEQLVYTTKIEQLSLF